MTNLLDEPCLGLAPRIVREMFRIIEQLRGMGVSIRLIEPERARRC